MPLMTSKKPRDRLLGISKRKYLQLICPSPSSKVKLRSLALKKACLSLEGKRRLFRRRSLNLTQRLEILILKQDLLNKRFKLPEPEKLPQLPPLVNLKIRFLHKRENSEPLRPTQKQCAKFLTVPSKRWLHMLAKWTELLGEAAQQPLLSLAPEVVLIIISSKEESSTSSKSKPW